MQTTEPTESRLPPPIAASLQQSLFCLGGKSSHTQFKTEVFKNHSLFMTMAKMPRIDTLQCIYEQNGQNGYKTILSVQGPLHILVNLCSPYNGTLSIRLDITSLNLRAISLQWIFSFVLMVQSAVRILLEVVLYLFHTCILIHFLTLQLLYSFKCWGHCLINYIQLFTELITNSLWKARLSPFSAVSRPCFTVNKQTTWLALASCQVWNYFKPYNCKL